ncbi:MAG TPA: DoxX family protein [Candidatus Bilamarchaeum sp.]|nr:DoxX family protein [Candidatus Bilamarchaeum sp.]
MAEEKGGVEKISEGAKKSVDKMKEGAKSTIGKVSDDVKEKLGLTPKDPYMDYGLLVIRIGLAMFMIHGFSKLTGLEGTAMFFGKLGIPAAGIMALFIGLLELVGGLAMLLGLGTRLFGLLLTINMVVAIVLTKLGKGVPELELWFLFGSLAIALTGPGKFSLREMLTKGKKDSILSKI